MSARTSSVSWLRDPVFWIVSALVAALLVKFSWSLFYFDQPLGYDPGMYRYLFIRHAEGFPPFLVTDLEPWARAHPLGLFMFSSVLMRLGVPVDWLIGWGWNLFAVVLLCTLAYVSRKRYSLGVGVWTLVAAVLSVSSFDGFAAMYWKTFASLLWMILAFRSIEKRSLWAVPLGILTVITHSQTGLLFGLVLASYAILPFIPWVQPTHPMRLERKNLYPILVIFGGGLIILCVGLLAYLPIWQDAVTLLLPALLGQTEAGSGSFPSAVHYLQAEAVVLLFGAVGFVLSVRRGRWSVWQLAVLWSLLFVVLRLLFYRRFFLQLEFFLLPFAGIALNAAWQRWKDGSIRMAIIGVLVVQAVVMQQTISTSGPIADQVTFDAMLRGRDVVPSDAFILGLENDSPVLLRGWFPHQPVGGPGLFDSWWTQDQWQKFLLGTHEERVELLGQLQQPVYLFASPLFRSYYAEYATQFLADPCFEQVDDTMFYSVNCMSDF